MWVILLSCNAVLCVAHGSVRSVWVILLCCTTVARVILVLHCCGIWTFWERGRCGHTVAGALALHACGYPGLMFSPGRKDAEAADDLTVLPSALDDAPTMVRLHKARALLRL